MAAVLGAAQVLERAVEGGRIPGVVALATDAQDVLYQGAFGHRRLSGDAAMTLDTVFGIASMTKPITAVAALQLVERGHITLDDPVADYLPEIAAAQVFEGYDAAGAPRLRPPRRPITLRHLLTHTAGFVYDIWNADLAELKRRAPDLQPPLLFDPGERWEYGTNLEKVGRLVERISDQSLEDYFRAHILNPLGMVDTTFVPGEEQHARRAVRHQRGADGTVQPVELGAPRRPASFNGGGGLFSTGPDYIRFLRMLLRSGELDGVRLLRSDTVAEMARNHIGALSVQRLPTTDPSRSNDAEFYPHMSKKWGLGGFINTERAPTGRSAGSWAWAGLHNTYFWIDPTQYLAGVMLTQLWPFCDAHVLQVFGEFERAVYASARPL